MMFPSRIPLLGSVTVARDGCFLNIWQEMMNSVCHNHPVWQTEFVRTLRDPDADPRLLFELAATWSTCMIAGSYCFPRYVAGLAARTEIDAVRYGLIENAWDEAGAYGHSSRSHFWLAVRLARVLGLEDAQIERVHPLPEAQAYTDDHYNQCAQGDFTFALGMICLIEEFTTPEFTMIFKSFLRSCQSGLGMNADEFTLNGGAEYFTANISDDERHREEMPRIVATCLRADGVDLDEPERVSDGLQAIRAGANHSADLRLSFFEGIYRYVSDGGSHRSLVT